MTLKVAMDRCDTCIFRAKYPREVRDRIFGETLHDDHTYISCHKHSIEDPETGEETSTVVCRGFYNRDPYHSVAMRVAAMFNMVEFVDEQGTPIACPIRKGAEHDLGRGGDTPSVAETARCAPQPE